MPALSINTLRSLFDFLETGGEQVLWIRSPDQNRQLYISPSYESIYGRKVEELYEHPDSVWDAVILPDAELMMARNSQRKNLNTVQETEDKLAYRVLHQSGEIRWIEDTAFQILDDCNQIIAYAGIAALAVEKNREKAQLRYLVDNILRKECQAKISDLTQTPQIEKPQLSLNNRVIPITQKEAIVLRYLKEGKSAKQTAILMHISPRTVEAHLTNLKAKTDSRTKLELLGKVFMTE